MGGARVNPTPAGAAAPVVIGPLMVCTPPTDLVPAGSGCGLVGVGFGLEVGSTGTGLGSGLGMVGLGPAVGSTGTGAGSGLGELGICAAGGGSKTGLPGAGVFMMGTGRARSSSSTDRLY